MDTVADLLARGHEGLATAARTVEAEARYVEAHLSALRAGAALLAAEGLYPPPSRAVPRSVWDRLPEVDAGLTTWAGTFRSSARRRYGIEAGVAAVDADDADALLAQAREFMAVVEQIVCSCKAAADRPDTEVARTLSGGCSVHAPRTKETS